MNKHVTIIGLTGGIGMGKSTVAAQLELLGAKICNADAIVHRLLAKGGAAVAEVGKTFPATIKNGAADRKALGEIVFKDKKKLEKLEHILHPLVMAEENRFIEKERRKGAKFIALDIPLLFETEGETRCDVTITASAPGFLQRQRVMKRPGMTKEKFQCIISSQMPDREKRSRADHVVLTGLGKAHSFRQLKSCAIVSAIAQDLSQQKKDPVQRLRRSQDVNMQREVVLDTETTGLDPASGHRVVEIGCIEVIGGIRSGAFFHTYLNPERDVPDEAFRVHGLSTDFLKNKPIFAEKVDDFLEFIAEDKLIIHNAAFDLRFVNAELERLGFKALSTDRAIDTVLMARKKFPGSPASLDALCRRFEIDLSERTKHGALLDAELLAEVYLELIGGRQAALMLDRSDEAGSPTGTVQVLQKLEARKFPPTFEELEAHAEMLAKLKKPLWVEYN